MTRPNRDPGMPSVETVKCPTGGLHVLRWLYGVIRCVGCKETWPQLDADLRAGIVLPVSVRHKNTPRPVLGVGSNGRVMT